MTKCPTGRIEMSAFRRRKTDLNQAADDLLDGG